MLRASCAMARTIDPRTGKPLPETSKDRTVEAAPLPPDGLPNTCDPLGTAHARGQLYGAVYDGRIAPAPFAVAWLLITLEVALFSLALLWDAWTVPVAYLIAGLLVGAWAWLFRRALRRMRERKRKLDIRIPPGHRTP